MRTQKIKKTITARPPKLIQVNPPHKRCICGACDPPKPKLPEGMRRLKVYSRHSSDKTMAQVPVILLQGKWLRSAGFEYGDEIVVTVNKKHLIVNFESDHKDMK